MEITLEKIELVKDRTGVSYKEAKEALEAADGSVVDAIIAIEETVDINKGGKTNEFVNDTMDKVKEMVKKGNVSKIAVKKGDETIVNIPVNVGVVGALVAPWGVIAAAIAAVIGRTPRSTFHMLDSGELPAKKVGGRWVAERSKLIAFFTEQAA